MRDYPTRIFEKVAQQRQAEVGNGIMFCPSLDFGESPICKSFRPNGEVQQRGAQRLPDLGTKEEVVVLDVPIKTVPAALAYVIKPARVRTFVPPSLSRRVSVFSPRVLWSAEPLEKMNDTEVRPSPEARLAPGIPAYQHIKETDLSAFRRY